MPNYSQPGIAAGPDSGSSDISGTSNLLQALEVFQLRLYPIWPIVDIPHLRDRLLSEAAPHYRLLATAIRLATEAQLQGEALSAAEAPPASLEHCDSPDLDSLRISFFLHIYHENKSPGGVKSLIYLRQALTLAQILRLDREASYADLPETEQQMRRRILWLLFVTERGVAMLHKLPVMLKTNVAFPLPGPYDRCNVLPAFLKLINLFWVFDQSGIFEILQNSDSDLSDMNATARGCLDLLQTRLQDNAADYELSNDVQKADIFVTRQWMRAVLWRAAMRFGATLAVDPVRIGEEFLAFVTQLPQTAIEAHGPTIEAKTYDIATVVIDAMAGHVAMSPLDRSGAVLHGLQRILSSSRGGNQALLASLCLKISSLQPAISPTLSAGRCMAEQVSEEQALVATPGGSVVLPSAWADLGDVLADVNILRTPGTRTPDYHSLEQQNQQMSWAPLDFTMPLMRTPSPLTRMFFDQFQTSSEEGLAGPVWTTSGP